MQEAPQRKPRDGVATEAPADMRYNGASLKTASGPMKKAAGLCLAALLLAVLVQCGQKGGLTRPEAASAARPAP